MNTGFMLSQKQKFKKIHGLGKSSTESKQLEHLENSTEKSAEFKTLKVNTSEWGIPSARKLEEENDNSFSVSPPLYSKKNIHHCANVMIFVSVLIGTLGVTAFGSLSLLYTTAGIPMNKKESENVTQTLKMKSKSSVHSHFEQLEIL